MAKRDNWWLDDVGIPGQGIRFPQEKQRETFFVALTEYFNGTDKAADKYKDWTAYCVRSCWLEEAPEVERDMVAVMKVMIYTIDKCDIEVKDLRARLSEEEDEKPTWDFITDEV